MSSSSSSIAFFCCVATRSKLEEEGAFFCCTVVLQNQKTELPNQKTELSSPCLLLLLHCRVAKSEEEGHGNSLCCSASTRKRKEGDCSRCHRLLRCAAARQQEKKKKKVVTALLLSPSSLRWSASLGFRATAFATIAFFFFLFSCKRCLWSYATKCSSAPQRIKQKKQKKK